MGILGGLGGIGWLLTAGATLIGSHDGSPLGGGFSRHRPAGALMFNEFETENTVWSRSGRFRAARAESAIFVSDSGAWSLSITAGRARSANGERQRNVRRDGLPAYRIGAGTSADLPGDFTLGAVGSLTYSSRPGPVALDPRIRHSLVADAGISIAQGDSDRLTLSYVEVSAGSGRTQLARMVELIGGSPRPGSGPRLAFSHRIEGARSGSLSWGFDASAMRMSMENSLLLGAPARVVDSRIALRVDRRF